MIKQFYFKQFSLALVHCLNVKHICLTDRLNPIRCYHSGPKWTWERWLWRCSPHSPKLQNYWSLTIKLFSIITRTLLRRRRESCPYTVMQSVYFTAPGDWAMHTVKWFQVFLFNISNSINQVFRSNNNNLHISVWFQVFLSNTNNLQLLYGFK